MKKMITFLTGIAVIISAANLTAFAEESVVAADIDEAAYTQLMENSWIYDTNGDNIITWEELEVCDRITVSLDGVTDISWFSRLKNCDSVFLSYGEITDFSILADMPALELVSFTSVPLTDISFIKDLELETCYLNNMEQITLEQRLEVMRNEDYTIEAGFDKVIGAYPKGILDDYNCKMTLDDTSVAEFSDSYIDTRGMFHGIYGIKPGSTAYRIYIDDTEIFTGNITVTETQVYSPELHNITAVSSEAMNSENYSSKVMLQNGTLYGIEDDTVIVCEENVKDFQYKYARRGYDESLAVDMLIKEDGTLYLNQTAVEGIKFRELENGCLISEDNSIYIVYPLNGEPVLYKIADDFKEFPYATEHLYINLSGELIWFGVAFDDEGNVIPTVEKTGVVNPVYIEEEYFIDENNALWIVKGTNSSYVKKVAENVAEVGSYINEDGTVEDGYVSQDGKIYAVDDGAELVGVEKYNSQKSYLDFQCLKYSVYDDSDDNIYCFITADRTLTVRRWEQHFAISDVDKILCLEYDSETELGYLYFVRTDGSIWQYCMESQEAKEMALPTASDKKIGDINADGDFTVADLVMLQNYLVRRGTVTDWAAGDLCEDNHLDVFDLVAMRQELISQMTKNYVDVSTVEELFLAMRNAQPGDVIRVASGTYDYTTYQGAQKIDTSAEGTEAAPITLTAADPENPPIITGTNTEHGYVIQVTGDYWVLENLKITTSQKGIVLDNSNHSIIRNCEVYNIGAEAIAIRDGSSYCTVKDTYIHDTGTVTPGYGEGVYIGSAKSVTGFDYKCDYNTVDGCTFKNVAAEHVDVKEYTTGTEIMNCTFYGDGMTGANNAGSFVDIAGNDVNVHDNIGYRNGNTNIVAAFELHEQVEGWGYHCIFTDNTVYMDQPYGAVDTSRRMYVVDGWYSDFSVKNNQVDYGEGLVAADSWEYYNSDYVTYLE